MSSDLDRREFLKGSVVIAAGGWIAGCDVEPAYNQIQQRVSDFAQPSTFGGSDGEEAEHRFIAGSWQPVVWTRRGGDYRLELSGEGVMMSGPTMTGMLYRQGELELGFGHAEIRAIFGESALRRALEVLRLMSQS